MKEQDTDNHRLCVPQRKAASCLEMISLAHDFYDYPLGALAVEFGVKDALPGAEV